ncbi:SDR family oxidoreductase [Nocardioides solisilvae]|uniref:SDR family oxidoreductase n=1 Tax=Nocardioides solisilvae TaxID=1542435 RepID=UPI000D740161|nr:SDR family oxidoreductase [Nocardioides solisilvae]
MSPSTPTLPSGTRLAVVTGASSGIGAATARALAAAGFHVVCAARRLDRLEPLAAEIGGTAVACDVTADESVTELAAAVAGLTGGAPGRLDVLVNNAGGAIGLEPVEAADVEAWQRMYDVNVLGVLRVTKALLPALRASGDGVLVNVGSTAGRVAYEGGAGYTAAKHGLKVMTETLRLELVGQPVRVSEVAPGMVATEEFSLNRFGGDADRAAGVYEGVPGPLVAEDVADAIAWIATRPAHVNIDELVIKPRAQAAQHKVHRV